MTLSFGTSPLHTLVMALSAIIFLLLMLSLVRVINSTENDLEWSHLVSTRGTDGKQYADWNKIGQGLGVILCVWLPAVYVYSPRLEAMGLAAVMGVALAYLGGVSGYAAMLRSRQGGIETTRSESTAEKITTEKVVETPPIAK